MPEDHPGYIDAGDRLLDAATRGGLLVIGIRCARCGAVLTAPKSMRAGVGPVCRKETE
ncbi:DUF6011 domain-containing protein [Tsukamurella sputi]|uniref:DUF6011 domain-containing protein n=1 Tax=Tsukamurella sputi TaxID=2591848 RepID=UPI0013151E0B|nr:DUF6011 domain-containing protein [Tsukamurella sputi]